MQQNYFAYSKIILTTYFKIVFKLQMDTGVEWS